MILSLIGQIVHLLVNAYIFVLFVRMILDWVSVLSPTWRPSGIISSLIGAVYQLTAPTLRWLRNIFGPFRWVPSTSMWRLSYCISFSS